ncbi:Protein of unknown function [Actinopolyspora alba]|uniref:DUF2637 domain-containing protein n=1 Tax=Actinopolyspora alba TaxID=673379 RepID=A0A1I1ZE45_9ACTN|nr:DUF2637 domain-containing protein [Actinopolyspora alba]SFE30021.1 Protein of unknown function [Actinopolyspora alba]
MTTPDSGVRLSRAHRWLAPVSLVIVAMAAVMGWAASFVGLHQYGHTAMAGFGFWTAWLLPATFDGAAFACTLMTYRASINGRSALRGRVLMWAFTTVSAWINWIHQPSLDTRLVAAGLPVAAVAVFDVVLAELRADYEARHGRTAFRLRPGLLLLRWLADRSGTTTAFRTQITSIPVPELAGLADQHTPAEPPSDTPMPAPAISTESETEPVQSAAVSPDSGADTTETTEEFTEISGETEPAAGDSAVLGRVRPSSMRLPEHVVDKLTDARNEAYRSGRSLTAADIQRLLKLPETLATQLADELAVPDTNGHRVTNGHPVS